MSGRIEEFIITMAVLIMSVTVHEFAHAFTADRLGDDTPRRQGRISLLPPDHLDPLGTIMMALTAWFGFGIGWGKPVLTNPANFRNPRRDQGIVAFAGPLSNIVQAIVFSLLIRAFPGVMRTEVGTLSALGLFLMTGVVVNLALAVFNMLPLKPLDGSWVATAVLPWRLASSYEYFMLRYGGIIFLLLVFVFRDVLRLVIEPPVRLGLDILLHGVNF